MSTRSTLWSNDDFHLFTDGFDNQNVYLEIAMPYAEQFVLKIPLIVWKELRRHTIQPEERYLDLTPAELQAEAEREVDQHRARLDEIRVDGGKNAGVRRMFGSFTCGSPDSSREEMIQRFIETYSHGRSETGFTVSGKAKGQA